jgi:hypothetical protein
MQHSFRDHAVNYATFQDAAVKHRAATHCARYSNGRHDETTPIEACFLRGCNGTKAA